MPFLQLDGESARLAVSPWRGWSSPWLPERLELVVQGKALNGIGIQTTIDDCLISDEVLEMHQAPMRERQTDLATTNP